MKRSVGSSSPLAMKLMTWTTICFFTADTLDLWQATAARKAGGKTESFSKTVAAYGAYRMWWSSCLLTPTQDMKGPNFGKLELPPKMMPFVCSDITLQLLRMVYLLPLLFFGFAVYLFSQSKKALSLLFNSTFNITSLKMCEEFCQVRVRGMSDREHMS